MAYSFNPFTGSLDVGGTSGIEDAPSDGGLYGRGVKDTNGVSLLLHMDGLSGSQNFIDSSLNNFTVTVGGNAQIRATEKRFGTGAGYFDGSGDYLRTELSDNNWDDDFTVEMWIKQIANNSIRTIFEAGDIQGGQGGVHVYVTGGTIVFNNGITPDIVGGLITPNQWTNIVISRSSGTNYLFQDGVLIGSGVQTFPVNNNIISIGAAPNYGFWFNGISYF